MKYLNIKKALAAWQELQPLSEKDRERLSRRFTVDFNYNSNHIEGNTLTYGQTEILLLFGKVIGEADVRDVQEMTASNVGLKMMTEEARVKEMPLTQNFIRTLHKTLLREDYTVYRNLPGGVQTNYTVHAGQVSINISKPGITKGQHWHNTKFEQFIVVKGHGLIQQRNLNDPEGKVLEWEVSGDKIQAVHMLPGYTHNIINLSDTEDLVTVMYCNEIFDPGRPDTFFDPVK